MYQLAWFSRIAGEDFTVVPASAQMLSGVDASFEARLAFADGLIARVASSAVAEALTAR